MSFFVAACQEALLQLEKEEKISRLAELSEDEDTDDEPMEVDDAIPVRHTARECLKSASPEDRANCCVVRDHTPYEGDVDVIGIADSDKASVSPMSEEDMEELLMKNISDPNFRGRYITTELVDRRSHEEKKKNSKEKKVVPVYGPSDPRHCTNGACTNCRDRAVERCRQGMNKWRNGRTSAWSIHSQTDSSSRIPGYLGPEINVMISGELMGGEPEFTETLTLSSSDLVGTCMAKFQQARNEKNDKRNFAFFWKHFRLLPELSLAELMVHNYTQIIRICCKDKALMPALLQDDVSEWTDKFDSISCSVPLKLQTHHATNAVHFAMQGYEYDSDDDDDELDLDPRADYVPKFEAEFKSVVMGHGGRLQF